MDGGRKIRKENVADLLALTVLQEGILFHYLNDRDSDEYFEQLSLNLTGSLDAMLVKSAWEVVVQANEMLRTVFAWEQLDKPIQIILKSVPLNFQEVDLSDLVDKIEMLQRIKTEDRKRTFDLEQEPAFRVKLCKLSLDNYEMIISSHHILYDGWSMGILLREFSDAYQTLANHQICQAPPKAGFKQYLKWLHQQDQEKSLTYWQEYLQGYTAESLLPIDYKQIQDRREMATFNTTLTHELIDGLKMLLEKHNMTISSFIYAIWGILLQKYNNMNDVVFGITVSGRPVELASVESMVGLFINTIPLRVQANPDQSILALCSQVHWRAQESLSHQNTPLVKIKAVSQIPAETSLFDSLVVVENYPLEQRLKEAATAFKLNSYSLFEMTNFGITLLIDLSQGVQFTFLYDSQSFAPLTITKMSEYLVHLMEQAIAYPECLLSALELVSEEEKKQILYEFNQTVVALPENRVLSEIISERLKGDGERTAALLLDQELTCKGLEDKSNQLARLLREKGVGRETIVAIFIERSFEMLIGIYAILKAGGAYLPVDPYDPLERVNYLLADSGCALLLHGGSRPVRYAFSLQF